MTTPREKVLELVSSGKITSAEGDELLASLGAPRRSAWQWLFDPLSGLSTPRALAIGGVAAMAALALGRLGIHFDGTLDVHSGTDPVSWPRALLELLANWPLSAMVFWGMAVAFGRRKTRPVDVLALLGLARVPQVISGAAMRALGISGIPTAFTASLAVMALVSMAMIGWAITLLVLGFRTATGLKGARWVVAFLAALLSAEVLSKLFLHPLR